MVDDVLYEFLEEGDAELHVDESGAAHLHILHSGRIGKVRNDAKGRVERAGGCQGLTCGRAYVCMCEYVRAKVFVGGWPGAGRVG